MKKLISIAFLFVILGCQKLEKLPEPSILLSEDKMVAMLIDMSLVNGIKNSARREVKDFGINLKEFICAKHNIESEIFKENLIYYSNDLKNYESLFKRTSDSLQIRLNSIDTIMNRRAKQFQEKETEKSEQLIDSLSKKLDSISKK